MPRPSLLLLLVSLAIMPQAIQAEPIPSQLALQYHYGDKPAWADPHFDDSAWPMVREGQFPAPGYQSDGFFWVRARFAVPADTTGPLAVSLCTIHAFPNVQELWVNGRLVGRYGDFPPHAKPLVRPQVLVFDIPAGIAKPGSIAVVALRTWDAPNNGNQSLVLRHPSPVKVELSIGSSPLLHALAGRAQDRAWLRFWPQFTLALAFIMLGVAVLVLGTRTRDRTLLLCALWLVAMPASLVAVLLSPLPVGASSPITVTAALIINTIAMGVGVEFLWTVQGFRDRIFRAAAHFCWIGLTIAGSFSTTRMQAGAPVIVGMLAANWFLFSFNVITGGADLVALIGRGRNRSVAAAMLLIPVGYFLRVAGHPLSFGWLGFDFFTAAFYLADIFIAVLLIRQTWTAWHKAEDLRIEFAAAREVQQRLVPVSLPHIDRFRLSAAYFPAAEVGGDFYQVFPLTDDSALIVIGDVSGKGLKAAMKGTLVLGALRALAQENLSPSQILLRLNAQLAASSDGGFVTCLCVHISADGFLTLANAGHLAPYRNGDEIPLESGLPLGIAPDTTYPESTFTLAPRDTLTFLSDGVVEARNRSRELFGFDRTAAISTQSAEEIARAAQAFSQEDDITVLGLAFAPAEMAHA